MKIEKGIPLPEEARLPFADMEVGDSFFLPVTAEEGLAPKAREVAMWAVQWQVENNGDGRKFYAAPDTADGKHGVRCWRTA